MVCPSLLGHPTLADCAHQSQSKFEPDKSVQRLEAVIAIRIKQKFFQKIPDKQNKVTTYFDVFPSR